MSTVKTFTIFGILILIGLLALPAWGNMPSGTLFVLDCRDSGTLFFGNIDSLPAQSELSSLDFNFCTGNGNDGVVLNYDFRWGSFHNNGETGLVAFVPLFDCDSIKEHAKWVCLGSTCENECQDAFGVISQGANGTLVTTLQELFSQCESSDDCPGNDEDCCHPWWSYRPICIDKSDRCYTCEGECAISEDEIPQITCDGVWSNTDQTPIDPPVFPEPPPIDGDSEVVELEMENSEASDGDLDTLESDTEKDVLEEDNADGDSKLENDDGCCGVPGKTAGLLWILAVVVLGGLRMKRCRLSN